MNVANDIHNQRPPLLESVTGDDASTAELAQALAGVLVSGDCLLLYGDLGAGKTAFSRGVIQALCPQALEVVSPTFTLLQTYSTAKEGTIWHFDLYRLKQPHELDEIGLDDALTSGITLIEWPQLAEDRLPDDALAITIRMGAHPNERHFTFAGLPSHWQDRLYTIQG